MAKTLEAWRLQQVEWVAKHEYGVSPALPRMIMERLKNRDRFNKSQDGHAASLWAVHNINMSRGLTRYNTEGAIKYIDDLPLTDMQKASLHWYLDCIIGTLLYGEDDVIITYNELSNDEMKKDKMWNLREKLQSVTGARKRQEAIRPLVEEIGKKFDRLPRRKQVKAPKNALMDRKDFKLLLPNNLKDPRFLDSDIEFILFPPDPSEEQSEIFEDQHEVSERMDDLLRDLGVDPD